jgi:hypothetical protein
VFGAMKPDFAHLAMNVSINGYGRVSMATSACKLFKRLY